MTIQCNICNVDLIIGSNFTEAKLKHKYYKCTSCTTKYKKKRRNELKLKAIEYKGGKCFDCNEVFHPSVYDFHHINTKDREKRGDVIRDISWNKMTSELDKCVLLCANCHRIRHHKE